ncbi:MAG TPA: twin-arginine translocase TatA/TatE family subunit [Methylomirabilota bacterium]|nr:twin-arginine translocase TatA/TatE family subunit [Methylomirabilota bacterium]
MGEFSIFHWLIVLAVVLIFFGGRRIPEVMKGLGEGIRSFKEGMSGNSAAATATAAPAAPAQAPAPSGITAKQGSASQIVLNWNASPGASSYNVKRSGTSGGPYTQIASTAATNFTDSGLASETKYFYVVSSYNAGGESANSAEVSGTPA